MIPFVYLSSTPLFRNKHKTTPRHYKLQGQGQGLGSGHGEDAREKMNSFKIDLELPPYIGVNGSLRRTSL